MNTPSLLMCVGWHANGCGSAITLNRFPTLPSVSGGTAVIVRHVNDNASWLVRRGVPFGSPKRQPLPHNTQQKEDFLHERAFCSHRDFLPGIGGHS